MHQKTHIRADGTRCVYHVTGDGPPVLLLHGFTMSAQMWRDNGVVAALAGRYRLLLPDFVGHGASDKPHDPAAYGQCYLDDITAILHHEDAASPVLVGFSMGAELALAWAAANPGQAAALFLMGSGWSPPEVVAIYGKFDSWARSLPEAERPAGWDLDALSAVAAATATVVGIPEARIRALAIPAEGLVGALDPERPYLERLNGVLPDYRLRVMEGIPHETSWQQPEVPTRISRFLDRALGAG